MPYGDAELIKSEARVKELSHMSSKPFPAAPADRNSTGREKIQLIRPVLVLVIAGSVDMLLVVLVRIAVVVEHCSRWMKVQQWPPVAHPCTLGQPQSMR
jgi:flagellar biosynthesis protein FliP